MQTRCMSAWEAYSSYIAKEQQQLELFRISANRRRPRINAAQLEALNEINAAAYLHVRKV